MNTIPDGAANFNGRFGHQNKMSIDGPIKQRQSQDLTTAVFDVDFNGAVREAAWDVQLQRPLPFHTNSSSRRLLFVIAVRGQQNGCNAA